MRGRIARQEHLYQENPSEAELLFLSSCNSYDGLSCFMFNPVASIFYRLSLSRITYHLINTILYAQARRGYEQAQITCSYCNFQGTVRQADVKRVARYGRFFIGGAPPRATSQA